MSDLGNHVAAVIPDKWNKVAVQLELQRGEISTIERNKHDELDRFMAVMEVWENSLRKPFTWDTLVAVLQSPFVSEAKLAAELQRDFC